MKNYTFFLVIGLILFPLVSEAQMKIHSSGGITFGSTTDPGSAIAKFDIPIQLNSNLNGLLKFHSSGGISFGSTTDPGSAIGAFSLPTDFNNNVVFNSPISISEVNSNIVPDVSLSLDLGSTTKKWNKLYVEDLFTKGITPTNNSNLIISGNILPSVDNTYNLGEVYEYNGTNNTKWKNIYGYNVLTDTLYVNGLPITTYYGNYEATRILFHFGLGDFEIDQGPTSYTQFYTSRSYYKFDEELWVPSASYVYSDIKLKTDITKIKDNGSSVEKIKELEGINYKLKDDKDELLQAGLSAQEVQEVMPELVQEDDEGNLAVNYTGIIPYLIEAIKEQEARITELEQLLKLKVVE